MNENEEEEINIEEENLEDLETAMATLSKTLGENVKRIELFTRLRKNEAIGISFLLAIGKVANVNFLEAFCNKVMETFVSIDGKGRKEIIELGKAFGSLTEITEGGLFTRFKRLIKREV
jgi:hypothetical protein